MSKETADSFRPFISVLIIIITVFVIVFVKTEIRRVGYVLWKQTRSEKLLRDNYYQISVALAQKMGPTQLNQYAKSQLDLKGAQQGQIIHMTSQQVALQQ